MRYLYIAMSAIILSLPGAVASADPLDRYAWNARLFLVFADSEDSPDLKAQLVDISANIDGFRDRELIAFVFAGDRLIESRPRQNIPLDGGALRAQFALPTSGFAAALVGFDTNVALRSGEPVDACSLFREIDGMPIRQSEMQSRGGAVSCRRPTDN